jgi:LPXTG-motif cell wall-anchored protein
VAGLQNALDIAQSDDTVVLDRGIDDAGVRVEVGSARLTLDLKGHTLRLGCLVLPGDANVTITGGTLRVDTTESDACKNMAAIGVPEGATLTITDADVTATASDGAGIGLGFGANTGESSGTVNIISGTVTALGSESAVTLDGGSLNIGAQGILVLPEYHRLYVPDGVTVMNAGVIRTDNVVGHGYLVRTGDSGTGKVANKGSILIRNVDPPEYGFVTGHNYLVRFHSATPTLGDVRVFAATFATGDRPLPDGAWTSTTGTVVTPDTDLSGIADDENGQLVVDVYQAPDTIVVAADHTKTTTEQPVTFTAIGFVGGQRWGVLTDGVLFAYGDGGPTSEHTHTFATGGTHHVTATWNGLTAAPITVQVADEVRIIADTALTTVGEPVTFTTTALDDGTDLADVTGKTAFTINGEPITGTQHTFTTGGTHQVTATWNDLTATTQVQVVDAIRITTDPATATTGQPVTLTVTAWGGGSNLGDITDDVSFTVGAGGTLHGNQVTFTADGDHTITATWGSLTASLTVHVNATPTPTPTPAPTPTPSVAPASAVKAETARAATPSGSLPATGTAAMPAALLAAFLLATGTGAWVVSRRRIARR